jgi:hypothetical protein
VSAVDVSAAGQRSRDAGIIVFAIGLGDDLDRELLTDLASSPAHAFFAPETEQLQGIYQVIAYSIPCKPSWP